MWPFKKETEEEKRQREMQEASIRALEEGGIPLQARKRIEEQRAAGKNFFTSDLSSREYLLCREAGFETISQVMGSCFYKVGYRGYYSGRYYSSGELSSLTFAQTEARRLAVSRMEQEASLLGASGVVGVRLTTRGYDWTSGLIEFTAVGTAIRIPGWESKGEPFSSDLKGQEFWQLYQAGFRPRGLVFGICSYYVYTNLQAQSQMFNWWGGSKPNQEVDHYTQCFLNARHLCMKQFSNELKRVDAAGAVGVDVTYDIEEIEYEDDSTVYHDVLLNFMAIGTAIVRDSHAENRRKAGALVYLDLASGSQRLLGNDIQDDDLDGL